MTRFRYPQGWNTSREPGKRPDLTDSWLAPHRKPIPGKATRAHVVSYRYWIKIHWATPPWVSEEMWQAMRDLYESANGAFEQVDHIVPLSHPLVCGLNVPWNLSKETIYYNQRKSNNYWPYCPDHLCPERNLPVDMFGEQEPHQQRLAL